MQRPFRGDLTHARALANQGHYLDAEKLFVRVLQDDPRQPEALAYQGWVLRQAGLASRDRQLISEGQASVQAAIVVDPTYPDAHAFMGYILLEDEHDAAGAVDQFRLFLADHPPTQMVASTRPVVSAAFASVGQPVPTATSATPGS